MGEGGYHCKTLSDRITVLVLQLKYVLGDTTGKY